MGKGDRKTKKGKIWRGTTGVRRPRKAGKVTTQTARKKD
ncbi:30S ribosomal protein THX [Marinoscillum furvescens]|uniref:30S ribosomal protein S31 n=1 Tax=Marinoscillum furvescens DSM 4134 TaxID=1122208 RepID=A0A3D9L3B2_MARFU|nr:30S ribosomal protein THX [Marinoscillum furvescens]RED97450.1 30S ribosomal protein S31 [Marinoscillum furvescens DSM 4134]